MKTPVVRPAPLLFVESLVTTFPARRRVRGAMIAAVGAHLLAGSALYAAGLVRFDALEKPVIVGRIVPPLYREDVVQLVQHKQATVRKGEADARGGGPIHPEKPAPIIEPVKVPTTQPAVLPRRRLRNSRRFRLLPHRVTAPRVRWVVRATWAEPMTARSAIRMAEAVILKGGTAIWSRPMASPIRRYLVRA